MLQVSEALLESPPRLRTLTRGPQVEVVACPTADSEAEQIVVRIERLLGGTSHFAIDSGRGRESEVDNLGFGDVAVLKRWSLNPAWPGSGDLATYGLLLRAARPIERDYIVSVALTGRNPDGTWAWRETHDTVPALITIPTLKWISGSAVFDPHRVAIPVDAEALAAGSMMIYDQFTQAPLSALDERLDPAVPLGRSWVVEGR